MGKKIQFCAECGRKMPYSLQKNSITRVIQKKEYKFEIEAAVCAGCGENIGIPGLLDRNAAAIERQYRELKPLLSLSGKMRSVIFRLLQTTEGLTPLALQKLLYFVQGIYMALYGVELFQEDCQAWAHGPVFQEVYEAFRDFRYHPIKDMRFSMFGNGIQELSDNEKSVIDLVTESIGIYDGKMLEKITHNEAPWKMARADSMPDQRSNAVIPKASIKEYFKAAAGQYDLASVEGIREYVGSLLRIN